MIELSKTEAEYVRKTYPEIPIKKTMKHKSGRGKYYVASYLCVVEYLKKTRQTEIVE